MRTILGYLRPMTIFRKLFTEHPESAGETYGEHFKVAMGFSRQLVGAGLAAAVHAVLPGLHKTTASDRIHGLHHCLETGDRATISRLRAVPCPEAATADEAIAS